MSLLQHYGGTVYYTFNDSVTHIVLTAESAFTNPEHALQTLSGIHLITEENLWLSIEKSILLSPRVPRPLSVGLHTQLYRPVHPTLQQFKGYLFILSISHP